MLRFARGRSRTRKSGTGGSFGPAVVKAGLQAGKFVGAIAKICGGGGGGRPNLAQAGGKDPAALAEALAAARLELMEVLSV